MRDLEGEAFESFDHQLGEAVAVAFGVDVHRASDHTMPIRWFELERTDLPAGQRTTQVVFEGIPPRVSVREGEQIVIQHPNVTSVTTMEDDSLRVGFQRPEVELTIRQSGSYQFKSGE